MVTTTELVLVVLAVAALVVAVRALKMVGPFVVNAFVGVLVLTVAGVFGASVEITSFALLVCAVGGVPGAVVVLALAYLDVAFVASVAPLAAVALP